MLSVCTVRSLWGVHFLFLWHFFFFFYFYKAEHTKKNPQNDGFITTKPLHYTGWSGLKMLNEIGLKRMTSMRRWKWEKKKWVDTFCFLLTFLLLFFSLFVSFGFGSLDFLEAGCVSAASFAFIFRVGKLLLARYPLVVSADWGLNTWRAFRV